MKTLKKWVIIGVSVIAVVVVGFFVVRGMFTNRSVRDTTFKFGWGEVKLQSGEVISGKVTRWLDFENSDMLQITIEGKTYLVHSANATLRAD